MKWIKSTLTCLLFVVIPGIACAGPAEDGNKVIDQWAAAFSANDREAVLKLYAPDAILLGTVSPIIAQGAEPIGAYFSRLPGSGNKVSIGDRRTMVLSESAVLGTGFYEFTRMQDGNPVAVPARFSMLLVKRGDGWLIAHHHSSMRPKPPQ